MGAIWVAEHKHHTCFSVEQEDVCEPNPPPTLLLPLLWLTAWNGLTGMNRLLVGEMKPEGSGCSTLVHTGCAAGYSVHRD